MGCDRPLEKQEFVTVKQLAVELQTCYLDYLPIDTNERIIVKARIGNSRDRISGSAIPLQPWIELDTDEYDLNLVNGELSLNINTSFSSSAYGQHYGQCNGFTEVEVTYTSGFNFCDRNDNVVQSLKASFMSIVDYLNSGWFSGQGAIKSKKVDDEFQETYQQVSTGGGGSGNLRGAGVGQVPETLLIPFKKYQPNIYEF